MGIAALPPLLASDDVTALIIAGLLVALVVAIGGCLTLGVTLAIGRGERCDLERDLAAAHADLDRISARNRELGADLAQARLDADTDVPDAATPELAARIDDLPHRRVSVERELDRWADLIRPAPNPLTPDEAAAWADLTARLRLEAS